MPWWPWQKKKQTPKPINPIAVADATPPLTLEERASIAFNDKNWQVAERLFREIITSADHDEVMAARTMLGMVLEKTDRTDEAILLFEENARNGSRSSFPYLHLAIIYHKRGQTEDEIRILERGIAVLRQAHGANSGAELKQRLAKLQTKGLDN
jgi:tetratricopeptide (TPR) repeat protein